MDELNVGALSLEANALREKYGAETVIVIVGGPDGAARLGFSSTSGHPDTIGGLLAGAAASVPDLPDPIVLPLPRARGQRS